MRHRHSIAPLLATIVLGCAQAPQASNSQHPREARYQAVLDAAGELGFPGFALVVDRADEPLWARALGHADLLGNRPLELDDPFHLASVTKAVTAMTTLRLVDRGVIGLDDLAFESLDREAVRGVPAIESITVRQLLEHTSGLGSFNNNLDYWQLLLGSDAYSGRDWSTAELIDFIRATEPAGVPGEAYHYADSNYVLLGELIAARTDTTFRDVVRREVFEPLAMQSAGFYSELRSGVVPSARPMVEGYLLMSDVIRTFSPHPDLPVVREDLVQATIAYERSDTAAGVVASPLDMRTFGRALFAGDFLSAEAHTLLREPIAIALAGGEEGAEAATILRAYAKPYGVVATAEGDGPGGVHTLLAYHPDSDTVVVAFGNLFGRFDEWEFLLERVLDGVLG